MACGAISGEVEDKRVQLVATKPVRYLQLWIGKWLGILLVNALLLAATGAITRGALHYILRTTAPAAAESQTLNREILVGRRLLLPKQPDVDAEILGFLQSLRGKRQSPRGTLQGESFQAIKRDLLARQSTVAPGQSIDWVFDLSGHGDLLSDGPRELTMRFALKCAALERTPVTGTWTLGTESSPELHRIDVENILDGVHQIPLPSDLFSRKGNHNSEISPSLHVRFLNAEAPHPGDTPQPTVFFDPIRGVELLTRETSFEVNLVRTLVVIFAYLASLSALGLTAGALFSFPVATFASVCTALAVLVALNLSPSFGDQLDHHGLPVERGLHQRIGERTLLFFNAATTPIVDLRPLGLLSDGVVVSKRHLLKALSILAIGLPAILAVSAAGAMSRRELAL